MLGLAMAAGKPLPAGAEGQAFVTSLIAGANSVTWIENNQAAVSPASVVTAVQQQASGDLKVVALWSLRGQQWERYLPGFPASVSTITSVRPVEALVVIMASSSVVVPPLSAPAPTTVTAGIGVDAASASRIYSGTNQFRTGNGLSSLSSEGRLQATAEDYARYLYDTNQFGHEADGRTAGDRERAHGYVPRAWGEVLYFESNGTGATPDAVTAWINSPPHNTVMKGTYRDIGAACYKGPDLERARNIKWMCVAVFGSE